MSTRYIVEKLTSDGRPTPGTLNTSVHRYANDKNAMRYFALMLKGDQFAPGQYRVSSWPESGLLPQREVGTLYKLAETPSKLSRAQAAKCDCGAWPTNMVDGHHPDCGIYR